MTLNSYLYISLMVISACFFIFTLWKKRDAKLLVLYMCMAGLTYSYEYIIFVWLESYNYYPQILDIPYYDSIFGAVASNGFTIPVLTVMIAAFGVGWVGRIILAVLLMGVEVLFIQLGVYEHYWYKTIFTGIGILIAFVIADFWLQKLRSDMSRLVRFVSLFMSAYFIKASVNFISSNIFQAFIYSVGWMEDPYRDSTAFITILNMFGGFVIALIVTYRLKWPWMIAALLFLTGIDYMLLRLEVLQMMSWSIWAFSVGHILLLIIVLTIDRYIVSRKGYLATKKVHL